MSKWSKCYGFPDLLVVPPHANILECANQLFGINITKGNRKLIVNYDYIIRRHFSYAMKKFNYDKIKYYLGINVPIHFGKSLCVNFIDLTYPFEIIKLLVDKIDGNNRVIIPLIYYCMKNNHVDESIILLDKFSKGPFISKLAYIFDDNEDYFPTILKQIISDKKYDLLETLGLEFTDNSCERGDDFFKILSTDCKLFDLPSTEKFKDDDLYTLLIKLAIREQYDYAMILLQKYKYPENILSELLETCAVSEIMPSYKDDLKKCVLLLLKKGAKYPHENLSKISNCYVFAIIGGKKFNLKYDTLKTTNEFLSSSTITGYYNHHSCIETFLKYLHDLFFSSLKINIYPLICANWTEMIYFLLSECTYHLTFTYGKNTQHILKKSCDNNHLEIVKLLLNNPRIGTNAKLDMNSITEAIEITCEKGLIEIMNVFMLNNRSKPIILSKQNSLAKLAYDNQKINIIDLLSTVSGYKLTNIIYIIGCNEFNDLLFKKILMRLWQVSNISLDIDSDIIATICDIYLLLL